MCGGGPRRTSGNVSEEQLLRNLVVSAEQRLQLAGSNPPSAEESAALGDGVLETFNECSSSDASLTSSLPSP